ncbi:NDR1/HIN1-like protein 12 [Linum perenne]
MGEDHHLPPEDDTSHQVKHASPPPPSSSYYGHRNVATAVTVFLLILAIIFLILWLLYRPHKPTFTVASVSVYSLNVTSPPFLSASFQFTILSRNPNHRVSILYDRLSSYVTYHNQPITVPISLPPLHHHTKTTVAVSPVIGGDNGQLIPVSVDVANGLVENQGYGVVPMTVVIVGKLRWKFGVVRSGRYGVYVSCDVWVGVKKRDVTGQVPLLSSPHCTVDV